MAEDGEHGSHGPLAALGGAGIGLAALLRVCSHEAAVVDDVARIAGAGASHADELARIGGVAGDDLARVGAVSGEGTAAGLGDDLGRVGDDVADAGDGAADVALDVAGHALDAVDVGSAALDLVGGGPGEASVWIGEPAGLPELRAGLARHPGAVVGFIARLDGARLRVGTSWIVWAELESACHRGGNTCWVYVGRDGAPESVARMSWNRTEGDEPERLDGFTGRVIPAR